MSFPHWSIFEPPTRVRLRPARGVALVLVLAFLVLLSGLVLAFFSRVLSDRQISNGSANQARVDLFAQGALDTVLGDLKQEIAAGSTAIPTSAAGVTVYAPRAATATPYRVGSPDALPNLVKRSASGQPFFAGADYNYDDANKAPYGTPPYPPSNRASAISSTTPSQNGRAITPARWNSHYLLPKLDANLDLDTDATPKGFTAPDWVIVSRDGTNPVAWANPLKDATPANDKFVVGRYAYAIYNEGGLLDMNVAGYPTGMTPAQTGYKPAVALADLTKIGLKQAQIDQLVGWRNYASIKPTGAFPNYTFAPAQATDYFNFIGSNTAAFVTTANHELYSGQSDRMFPGRQALMRLLLQGIAGTGNGSDVKLARAHLQNSLQYMGAFTRDLEQPSYFPSAALPKVQLSSEDNSKSPGRGNDAYDSDRFDKTLATKSPFDINPPFLAVRVAAAFTRPDGAKADIGDPLVKTRFPLSRLGLILHDKTAVKDDSDPIYRNFGLYRANKLDPWTYDHGDGAGILRLSGVAQKGREADFFELLKAGINVGSLGKSLHTEASSSSANAAQTQYRKIQHQRDIATALHVLQIGADIIDQYDADSFPTRITFAADAAKEVRGIEDIPYIYHLRNRPAFVSSSVGRWLMQPVMWNPHDPASGTPSDAPTSFRVRAQPVISGVGAVFKVSYNGTSVQPTQPQMDWDGANSFTPLTFNAGASHGFYDFRQPTLLAEANIPNGTNAAGNNFAQANVDPEMTLIGVVATDFVLRKLVSTPPAADVFAYVSNIDISGPSPGVEFVAEYLDGGKWIPYDSFICWWNNISSGYTFFKPATTTDAQATTWIKANYANIGSKKAIDWTPSSPNGKAVSRWAGMTRTDPRTNRWSMIPSLYINVIPAIDPANNIYESYRGRTSKSYGDKYQSFDDLGLIPPMGAKYLNADEYRGFQHGYWAENSVRATAQDPSEGEKRRFNYDPDGVVRRAMAGYSTDPKQGGSLNTTSGLPMANNNFESRPLILNRPFKSVAELGYAYQGTAWKNLNFSAPESGDVALLDVFCVSEPGRTDGLVAGKVDLNTRQSPVLQALLSGANVETSDSANVISSTVAGELAEALVTRTGVPASGQPAPLSNRADLVGKLKAGSSPGSDADPDQSFTGFSSDIGQIADWKGTPPALITRKRESAIRALVDAGTARTWNLHIDLVAQTGRFTSNASKMESFNVDGEKRYWLHVALDRYTGKVIDQKLEPVTE